MKHRLKIWLDLQAARVNAMSLRERIFLFAALMAGCVAIADTLWLSPAQASHQSLVQKLDQQTSALQRARADLKAAVKPDGPASVSREELAEVNAGIEAANQAIKEMASPAVKTTPLAQMLVHVLRKHDGLTLVRAVTLAPPNGPAATALAASWPIRQGVELTVTGPYPELTRYLAMLEKVLPQMRWGKMTMKSDKLPPELTLQLFSVELKP
jgi:MSHA biogenesis protein MshJ